MKTCSKCKTEKEDQEFYKNNVCRECYLKNKQEYYIKNKEKISDQKKQYNEINKEKIKLIRKEKYIKNKDFVLKKQKEYQKINKNKKKEYDLIYRNRKATFNTYYNRLSLYNEIKKGKNNLIEIECYLCKKVFNPTNAQCKDRIYSIEKNNNASENNFYCSEECKVSCSVYRKRKYIKGTEPKKKRETSKEFDQIVFKERNNECEKCGSKEKLQIHHIKGYTLFPELRFDLNNVLLLCKECHKKVHSQNGCKHNQLVCKNMGINN